MNKQVLWIIAVVAFGVFVVISNSFSGGGTALSSEVIGMTPIEGETALSYRNDTKVVFILFNERNGNAGYGYMSPHVSERGFFCRYIDGQIVEIEYPMFFGEFVPSE